MKKILLILGLVFVIVAVSGGVWYFKKYDTSEYEHKGFFPLPILKPIWERKIQTSQEIKIGMITDTHVHPKRIDRSNEADDAPRHLLGKNIVPLDEFNVQMDLFNPDIIVHLGDVIEGTNDKDFVGIMGLQLVQEELNKNDVPVYWVLGNHDLRSVTKDQFKNTLGLPSINQTIDRGDYRFIILDANFRPDESDASPGHGYTRGYIPDFIFEWLITQLETDKQVFVFMHYPALKEPIDGKSFVEKAEYLRELLAKYNVKAIFSGHIEIKKYENNDGIKYYSLVGTKKNKEYARAYYELTIKSAEPDVVMYYTDLEKEDKKRINLEE